MTDAQIIVGKFLGALGLLVVTLLLSLVFPLIVSSLGELDMGLVLGCYIGLFLVGAAYGDGAFDLDVDQNRLWPSSSPCSCAPFSTRWTRSSPGCGRRRVAHSPSSHSGSLREHRPGVIDSRDVIFYLSVIGTSLAAATCHSSSELSREEGMSLRKLPEALRPRLVLGTLAIAALVNVISQGAFGRLDLTENNLNTLSSASIDAVAALDEVEVTAYISLISLRRFKIPPGASV